MAIAKSSLLLFTIISQVINPYKGFYQRYLLKHLIKYFPKTPIYKRFIEYILDILVPLTAFMQSRCGQSKGIVFVDSTPLCVCKNIRISRHKTCKQEAQRGKSSTGWFYGFKLHIIVDDCGEICRFRLLKATLMIGNRYQN